MNTGHRKRLAFAPPKPWVSFICPAAVCLENAIDLCWFVGFFLNKAVETQVACIDVSFFISYQCPFHCYPLLADPLLACPTGENGGSLVAYHALYQTNKGSEHVYTCACAPPLNSILCWLSGDWHFLCPSEGGFICWKTWQLGRILSLFSYQKERQKWGESRREWGSHSFLAAAWNVANVGTCGMS